LRLDQNIIGTADHHEMFDIVTSHQDKLTLPVEIEGIHNTEARLTCPAAARHVKPASEYQTNYKQNQ